MELDDKQKRKVEKVALHLEDSSLALHQEVAEINEHLEGIHENLGKIAEKEDKEAPEVQKVELVGAEIVTIKGIKGDSPTDEHLLELITPLIPEPITPKDGKDYVLTEKDKKEIAKSIPVPIVEKVIETIIEKQPIITNEIKEVALTDTASQIRDKLESLEDDDRLDAKAIKGLKEQIDELNVKISSIPRGGGGGRSNNSTKFTDLSSQANGTLKVFSVPKNVAAIVLCSDFPTVLMEGNGFSLNSTRTQLTLTVENAPSQGSQLLFQYSSMFN